MVVGCVGTGYVLRVELPVQRRLCPIFVRDVGSPDIHECFHGLTGSQRTPGIWGVTELIWGGGGGGGGNTYSSRIFIFRVRECHFSLNLRAIRPSKSFGPRRKDALRREAYVWTPVLRSFVKRREVRDLSYLSFTLYLSVLSCFGWLEALNGLLIGLKSWNRIVVIFEAQIM